MILGRVANEIYHLQCSKVGGIHEGSRPEQVGGSTVPYRRDLSPVGLVSALSRLVWAQMTVLTDAAPQLHKCSGAA